MNMRRLRIAIADISSRIANLNGLQERGDH
jgi:hypothetical protein